MFVIQCKRYAPSSSIASRELRDLLGAKVHFQADVAVFVTTTRFSRPSERFAVEHGILAVHRDHLGLWNNGASLLALSRVNGRGQGSPVTGRVGSRSTGSDRRPKAVHWSAGARVVQSPRRVPQGVSAVFAAVHESTAVQHLAQVASFVSAFVRPAVEQDGLWTGSVLGSYQDVDGVAVDALAERRCRSRRCAAPSPAAGTRRPGKLPRGLAMPG
ncbi:restriction endonuclease [Streptomyces canus]|uniref:restriction endonuclease n=1 Tax=Streptomyces canus TaxID=58343 RepID=UPI0038079E34